MMADDDNAKPTGVAAVKYLREQTGQSIEECVRLLNAADGDIDRAMAMRFDPGVYLPPTFRCPKCGKGFAGRVPPSECQRRDWLRFPSERAAWGTAGPCRRCGFAYRWDGEHCSHCGLNTHERPAVRVKVTMPLRRVLRPR